MDEKLQETKNKVNIIRNQLIITLRALQLISMFTILAIMSALFFPITIWGLLISIILLILYIRKIEKKIKEKIKEETEEKVK